MKNKFKDNGITFIFKSACIMVSTSAALYGALAIIDVLKGKSLVKDAKEILEISKQMNSDNKK